MRKPMLWLTLLMLCASCVKQVPVYVPAPKCEIKDLVELTAEEEVCGDKVCYPVPEAVKLAGFLNAVAEYKADVHRCPQVKHLPASSKANGLR